MNSRAHHSNIQPISLDGPSPSYRLVILSVLFILMTHCTRIEELLQFQTPRESYLQAMQNCPLSNNPLFHQWMAEGDSVLGRPLVIKPPFQQKMIYFPDEPVAWAWELDVQAGRRVEFVCMVSDTSQRLFIDLFSDRAGDMQYIATMEDTSLSFEAKEHTTLLLRLQPEILVTGGATLIVKDYPMFGFPVQGARPVDIGSFWGDARDGGLRLHEGVDIFAARGTPVVAVAKGRTRTGEGGLGGKKVWLRTGDFSLYHAHLDSIMVHSGQSVAIGDTLGTVGNTGNARTTPPHLHFGIYRRGAVNPLPFIEAARTESPPVMADIDHTNRWGRIIATANIRPDPSTYRPPLMTLSSNNVLAIRGITNGWYEVLLPDQDRGFIHHNLVSAELTALSEIELSGTDSLIYPVNSDRLIIPVKDSWELKNYGKYGDVTLSWFRGHWVGIGK